jgi:hypothetical protein
VGFYTITEIFISQATPFDFRKHKKRHEPPKDQLPKPTTTTIDQQSINDIDMGQEQQEQQQIILPVPDNRLPDRITLPLPLVQQLMPPLLQLSHPEGIPYFT